LMSRALASLRLVNNDRVAVLRLSKEDFLATGAGDGDTEDVVNRGLLPPSVLVSVFLREQGESVKISLRGKGEVDLCRLAVSLGGGGHKNASGVTLAEPLDRAEIKVLSLLKKVL